MEFCAELLFLNVLGILVPLHLNFATTNEREGRHSRAGLKDSLLLVLCLATRNGAKHCCQILQLFHFKLFNR